MTFDLNSYLRDHFPALVLGGALFYRWPIGIRFDLGERGSDLAEVQRRATTLFEATFIPGDTCIVVSQDWPDGDTPSHGQTHLSMLSDFAINQVVGLRQPSDCLRIQEEDGNEIGSYTLTWFEQSARDFQYGSLLAGIANHRPRALPSAVRQGLFCKSSDKRDPAHVRRPRTRHYCEDETNLG